VFFQGPPHDISWADVQISLRIKKNIFSIIFDYNDGITNTNLKNTFEGNSDLLHQSSMKQVMETKKEKNKKKMQI
jgi:hypothetical protein